jgi:UDP-2-acetamido-3-amino-2,3-dideoxy-glucuronate N-acetyltransferase
MAEDLGVEFSRDAVAVLARDDITGVAIGTPAVTHAEVVTQALNAGKHVFVEKPIALSVSDANAVAALAKSRGLTLMTGHLLQYHPIFIRLLAMVKNGELGKLQYVYSNRLNQGRVRTEENALWSLAPHDISMILALAGGKPTRISAIGQAAVQPGIPDISVATYEFAHGVKAHLFCSWLNPYKEHRLAVIGDKAMAVFDDTATSWDDKLNLYPHKVEWKGRVPEFVKANGQPVVVEKGEPLRDEMAHFLACVAGYTGCRTGPEEAIPVLEVLAATQAAIDSSTPVSL